MFNYVIKVRLSTNTFKNFYIKEERYLKSTLNVLNKYYSVKDIIIVDKFNNKISAKNIY